MTRCCAAACSPARVHLVPTLSQRTDEGAIKQFFADLHELYLKVHTSSFTRFRRLAGWLAGRLTDGAAPVAQTMLNPFYDKGGPITSPAFDARVRALGKKL